MGTILCYHKQPEINIEIKEEIIKDFPLDTKRHKEINNENNNSQEDSGELIEEDNNNQEKEYQEEIKKSEEREIIEQQLKQENFCDKNISKSIVE